MRACTQWTLEVCPGLLDVLTQQGSEERGGGRLEQARTCIWLFDCVIGIWYMLRIPSLE